MKKYQALISQRYLRTRMVNLIAIIAVTLGVAALILVSSVMNGFSRDIQDRIRGIMSHIVVDGDELVGINNYGTVMRRIEKVPHVAACAPLVESPFVLIRAGDQTRFGQIRGIDPALEAQASQIDEYRQRLVDDTLKEAAKYTEERKKAEADPKYLEELIRRAGTREERIKEQKFRIGNGLAKRRLDFRYDDGTEPASPGILIGVELAASLGGLRIGDKVTVTSATTILTFKSKEFTVVGGFRIGHYIYDNQLAYVPLASAQELLGLPGRVTSISVRLDDIGNAARAKPEIARAILNPVPLADPANAADLARIHAAGARVETHKDDDGLWLSFPAASQTDTATVTIDGLEPLLQRAEDPTTLAFDVRCSPPASAEETPWFVVGFVDSAGRTYRSASGLARQYPSTSAFPARYGLANFTSKDGLDTVVPANIRKLVIETHGPVEFANVRFEDDQRVRVSTWRDKQRNFLAAVDIEKYIQFVIMALMVVVGGFSVMSILWLMVKEKTRDIGILMSLGATRRGIVSIFLLNGLTIGVLGGGLGFAAGWVLSANLNRIEDWVYRVFHWRMFPPDIYYLDRLPHVENPGQFLVMGLLAVAVSLAASLWPAFKASRLDPIEALRYE